MFLLKRTLKNLALNLRDRGGGPDLNEMISWYRWTLEHFNLNNYEQDFEGILKGVHIFRTPFAKCIYSNPQFT